jgi:hypothetical protein
MGSGCVLFSQNKGNTRTSNDTVVTRSRAIVKAPEEAQTAPARFVREVRPGETIADLIGEGKAATWVNEAEHAVISLEKAGPGKIQRVIVSGGRDGIDFIERDGKLFIRIGGHPVQVKRIIGLPIRG